MKLINVILAVLLLAEICTSFRSALNPRNDVINPPILRYNDKPTLRSLSPSSRLSAYSSTKTVDYSAIVSYFVATAFQYTAILTALHVLQIKVLKGLMGPIEDFLVAVIMFFLSVRSRVFSPLKNSRPSAKSNDPVFKERLRPSWQPPPIAFPFIWTTIAFLRTISSLIVYKKVGTILSPAIFSLVAHLSIGDTWNTVNNVEGRLGTAFGGVLLVLASVIYAVKAYFDVSQLAGYVLAPSAVWLSIASCLVYSIWQLNKEKFNNPSIIPMKEERNGIEPFISF